MRTEYGAKRMTAREAGFTLIELMATLLILGMVLVIAVPAVGALVARASTDSAVLSASSIERAAEFAAASGEAFDLDSGYSVSRLVERGFLKATDAPEFAWVERVDARDEFVYHDTTNESQETPPLVTEPPEEEPELDVPEEPELELPAPASPENSYPAGDDASLFCPEPYDNDTKIRVTCYTGSSETPVVPKEIDGLPVTAIGAYAFAMKRVTNVTLPPTLEEIESGAFWYSKLTEIHIPEGVTVIRDGAFSSSSKLTTVTLPNSLRVIEDSAFMSVPLTSLVIPQNVESIGELAFAYHKFTTIDLPASVAFIGNFAFASTTWLTDATVRNPAAVFGDGVTPVFGITSHLPVTIHGSKGSTAEAHAGVVFYAFQTLSN